MERTEVIDFNIMIEGLSDKHDRGDIIHAIKRGIYIGLDKADIAQPYQIFLKYDTDNKYKQPPQHDKTTH